MTEDEKLVRETWFKVTENHHGLSIWDSEGRLVKAFFCADMKPALFWPSAADFTRQRLQEIADLEEEMDWISSICGTLQTIPQRSRIFKRLEAMRDEKKRGMR